MKTTKWKSIIVGGFATFIGIVGTMHISSAQTAATWPNSPAFKQEKLAINNDLTAITLQQARVNSLEKQCRSERASRLKTGSGSGDLLRAKADLQKDKDYLKADKEGLMMKYEALISEREAVIRNERAALTDAQHKLNAELAKGQVSAEMQTQAVVNSKHDLMRSEAALRRVKIDRNEDMLALNQQIRSVNGESPVVLTAENSKAKTQNLAMK